jgi:hypothetical protein
VCPSHVVSIVVLMCVETATLFEHWTYDCSHLQRHRRQANRLGPRFYVQARVCHMSSWHISNAQRNYEIL